MKITKSIVFILLLAFYHSYSLQLQHLQGIKCDDQCVSAYNSLTKQKTYRYVIYKIDKRSQTFILDKAGNRNQNWSDFVSSLPVIQCRLAYYDLNQGNEKDLQKIIFVFWSPDSAKVREKLQYAQNKDNLKFKFLNIKKEIEATDESLLIRPEI